MFNRSLIAIALAGAVVAGAVHELDVARSVGPVGVPGPAGDLAAVETGVAVEEALVLTERHGGEVHLVLIGPERAQETIRKALAMGAEAATHLQLDDEALDSRAYAELLAEYLPLFEGPWWHAQEKSISKSGGALR